MIIALGLALLAGSGVVAALAGDAGSQRRVGTHPQRMEHEGGPRATHLLVSSEGRRRIAAAESFCAPSNGEPIALACGSRVRAPRGDAFLARPGATVTLRFGTAVRDVWLRYGLVGKAGRVTALTYATPLRSPDGDVRVRRIVMSRDPTMRRRRLVLVVSAAYRDPIAIDVRGRRTKPFADAFAEFAVPLRVGR